MLALLAGLMLSVSAYAEDYVITIKNSQFSPKELTVPAGQKVKITVKNQDATPAEFESSDLNREKIVSANSQIFVFIGPLDAGSYSFFNDFHRESTGTILAK
jgi:plastocyanin